MSRQLLNLTVAVKSRRSIYQKVTSTIQCNNIIPTVYCCKHVDFCYYSKY